MIRLFGDFGNYLSFVDGYPSFNRECYINNHSSKDKVFFERIADSQNFNFFLQNEIKEVFPYFYKLCLRYCNNSKITNNFEKRSNSLSKLNVSKSTKLNSTSKLLKVVSNVVTKNSSFENNSENNSNNSISTILEIKGNDYLENFLITPYFINESILKSNVYLVDDLINLRFKGKI